MKETGGEYSAFISFASENRDKADAICASLERRGFVCWIAPRDVRAGREYADEIIGGIERSACVVLILSEAANASVFVDREVERAFSKNKPVFPVRIEEVTPSPSLELFISGTHWLDAWSGDWDAHMARLARDLSGPAGRPITSGRPPEPERRKVSRTSIAAGLVIGAVLSGVVIWSFPAEAPPKRVEEPPPAAEPRGRSLPNQVDPQRSSPPAQDQAPPETSVITPSAAAESPAPLTASRPASPGSPRTRQNVTSPPGVPVPAPAPAPASAPAPLAPEATRALNELREDYDALSIRGEVVDEALNRLWEEMRPLSPRVDMATRQRSLQTYLSRSREALAERDAAQAKRYLDMARADLAALDQFLGR